MTVSNPISSKSNTPLSFSIHWTDLRSAATYAVVSDHLDASYILCLRLCYCCCSLCAHLPPLTPPLLSYIFPWAIIYPAPPLSLYLIPRRHRVFLVLCQRLCRFCLLRGPVLLCQRRRRRCQYPEPVDTPAPPPLETFNWTCCIFCVLN